MSPNPNPDPKANVPPTPNATPTPKANPTAKANPKPPGPTVGPASPPGATLYGMYVVSLAACLIGNLLIRMGAEAGWLPRWAQVLLGLATAAPLAVAAVLFWRLLRRELDEMLQRIVLEGLAFALVVYVPLAALYVNLRTAGAWVPRLDPPDILLAPAVLAAIGFALARRRFE